MFERFNFLIRKISQKIQESKYLDFLDTNNRKIMRTCLVITGKPQSGKTEITRIIKKTLNVQVIHFDHIISLVSDIIRKFFEKKEFSEEEKQLHTKRNFYSIIDFDNFILDFNPILIRDVKLFKKIYETTIKVKKPSWSFRSDTDSRKDFWNLGIIGKLLNPYGSDIVNLVIKHVSKHSNFFVVEGACLSKGSNYLKQIQTSCSKFDFLQTYYNSDEGIYYYDFNNKKITSTKEIIDILRHPIPERTKLFDKQSIQNQKKHRTKKYQQFNEDQVGDSPSYLKIKKLGIPENLQGKFVLDLGCNEGFYCFQCEKKGAKVVGVESDQRWYNLALERKKELSSVVNFINMSWSDIDKLNYKFDLVLFLAAFHYVRDDQEVILKKIFGKINPHGLLVLEVGLSPENEGSFFIEKIKRKLGDVCQYPNKFTIENLLVKAGFKEVKLHGKGFDIKGDPLPRFIVHAKK